MRRALIAAALLALAGCSDETAPSGAMSAETQTSARPHDLAAYFDCLRESGFTTVSAHRGGPAPGLAENAIETFAHTLSAAPQAFLEVDVAETRDGELVLMHDDTVDRTTNGSGPVSALTLAQVRALQLQDRDGQTLDAHPPSLSDALAWSTNTVLELDVKRGVSYEDVAAAVREADAMNRVVFITYSVDGASRLARVAPEAMIYTTITSVRDLDTLERRGVDLGHIVAWLGDEELDEDLLHALNARDVEARWGVFDRYADFAAAAETGVQGLAVNAPDAAYRAIDATDGEDGFAARRCVSAG